MALIDFIPTDATPSLALAPDVQTRRVYDRSIYSDDTPNTKAPVVTMVGLPVRVEGGAQTTIYAKPYNGVMVSTSDPLAIGAWYADVIISNDPDITPEEVLVTLTHGDWAAPETRAVPSGSTPVCWTDLALVEPPEDIDYIFVGGIDEEILELRPPWVAVVTGTEVRPTAPSVIWYGGTTLPSNALAADIWLKEVA